MMRGDSKTSDLLETEQIVNMTFIAIAAFILFYCCLPGCVHVTADALGFSGKKATEVAARRYARMSDEEAGAAKAGAAKAAKADSKQWVGESQDQCWMACLMLAVLGLVCWYLQCHLHAFHHTCSVLGDYT